MKILFVSNHAGFSKFNAPYMEWCKQQGWVVDNASPGLEVGMVDNQFNIIIQRSPFSLKNIRAFYELKKVINEGQYNIIHCQTPNASVLTRLAARKARKHGTKVIYTAHGFHFFKGASLKYWLLFFPIEVLLARYTDTLVTVNQEDYERALKCLPCKRIRKLNGVGVDFNRFKPLSQEERRQKRQVLNLKTDDFILLYTAQFIKRKNHQMIIRSLPNLVKEIPKLKVIFVGHGPTLEASQLLAQKLKVDHLILFLGGRRDVDMLCGISDIHVSVSFQEGLATCNIEAMACGLPIIVSRIRGHVDLCKDGINGFLFDLHSPDKMEKSIIQLYKNKDLYKRISENNLTDAQSYSIDTVLNSLSELYKESV